MIVKSITGVLVAAFLVTQVACSVRTIASNVTASMFVNGSAVLESQTDPELARDHTLSLINMLEVLRADNPKSKDLNMLLARSYGNYGYGFWEQDLLIADKDSAAYDTAYQRADAFYKKGRDYGLSVLKQSETFNGYGKKDVPLLYWTAFNWANWINLHKDSPTAIVFLSRAEAMMARCLELDPNYYYGGIHQFYGAYYASRPAMLGGNADKAKQHFDQAIAATDGKFLMAKVVYAQYYAVAVQDKALYERLLNEVIAADPAALPEARLANELAIIRAKTLLAQGKNYF